MNGHSCFRSLTASRESDTARSMPGGFAVAKSTASLAATPPLAVRTSIDGNSRRLAAGSKVPEINAEKGSAGSFEFAGAETELSLASSKR